VGLNKPVSMGEMLQERAQEGDETAAQALQQLMQTQDPRLSQPVDVKNNVAEIDVDIILEEVPDTINMQGEQFDLLVKMYQANPQSPQNPDGIPWNVVVEMSTLRNKSKLLGKEQSPEEQQAAQAQQQEQQRQQQIQEQLASLEANKTQSEIEKNNAAASKTAQEEIQLQLENALIMANPAGTSVSI